MNKPASTLSIRLQLPPDEEDQPKNKPDETIYLWDRIIIAALAATIVVAGIVAGAWYALSGPIQEPMSPAMAASQSSDTVRSAAAEVKAPAASAAPLLTAAEPKPIENPPPAKKPAPLSAAVGSEPTAVSPSPKAAANSAKPATATTEPSPLAGQAAPIETSKKSLPISTAEAPADAAPSSAAIAAAKQNPAPTSPREQPATVEVLSDRLVHAQLSNRLINRKPLDQAPAVIPMNEQGLVTVYFYTELQDMQGKTLYYNWYREDKRVARVRARPQRALTRAYTSKFIDRYMLGHWRVELTSAEGEPLARAEFEVRDSALAAH